MRIVGGIFSLMGFIVVCWVLFCGWQCEIDDALFMELFLALWGKFYPDMVECGRRAHWVGKVFVSIAAEFRND